MAAFKSSEVSVAHFSPQNQNINCTVDFKHDVSLKKMLQIQIQYNTATRIQFHGSNII